MRKSIGLMALCRYVLTQNRYCSRYTAIATLMTSFGHINIDSQKNNFDCPSKAHSQQLDKNFVVHCFIFI